MTEALIAAVEAMTCPTKYAESLEIIGYNRAKQDAIALIRQHASPKQLPTYCAFCNGLDGRHYQDCTASQPDPQPLPDEGKVQRVARAICNRSHSRDAWAEQSGKSVHQWEELAEAAIAAMPLPPSPTKENADG